MYEIYVSNNLVALVKTLDQAHAWLIDNNICDDDIFHVIDINTGEWVSHTHNGQLYR